MIKQILFVTILLMLVGTVSAEHQMPTDLTEGTGLFEGMALWAYNVTNGMFWALLLAGFCIVLFISASVYSSDRAFGYAGATGIFGSMMLATLGLMTWWITSIFILAGVIGIAMMIMARRG